MLPVGSPVLCMAVREEQWVVSGESPGEEGGVREHRGPLDQPSVTCEAAQPAPGRAGG